jgi:hypothetical protein
VAQVDKIFRAFYKIYRVVFTFIRTVLLNL